MKTFKTIGRRLCALTLLSLTGLFGAGLANSAGGDVINDYPTAARAEYVFACMASNGQTRRALEQCSCSVDVIATIVSYDDYVAAETILRLRLVGGEKGAIFRSGPRMKETVANLKRAQVEAEIRCF